ncbi:MAG: pyridoxal phosphate-dependent aminotransferase [Bdellovibrionales bacterium]
MISKRAQSIQPSPTLSLAAKAKAMKAEGKDVVSLTVGEPDWNTFPGTVKAGVEAIQAGQTKYAPASGLPDLRKAIADDYNANFGMTYEMANTTVSAGAKFIIYSALMATIDPGDEVVFAAPYWVSYPEMIKLAEGIPVVLETKESDGFKITAEGLESSINSRTKAVLLNSPSNPTGLAYSKEELQVIAGVLKNHPKLLVISDDIYNLLYFKDRVAPHILEVAPELVDRTICINGASKAYSMTGWRVGWALGPKDIMAAMSKLQSQSVSCAPSFAQIASLHALKNSEEEIANSLDILSSRLEKAKALISKIDGVEFADPDGAFYLWIDIKSLFNKSYKAEKIVNSQRFSEIFLEDFLVASVPGNAFGMDGYLRFSYALAEDRFEIGMNRLAELVASLK